jgi:excinuclease UvrABC nuclease subunit
MRSSDLSEHGFGYWSPFSRECERAVVAGLPKTPGVYALRFDLDYPRRVGASDILYIGSATNRRGLRGRIPQYFHPGPTQRTNKRILDKVSNSSGYCLAFAVTKSIPEAKMLEASLLEKYEVDHGELPPENLRH